MRHKKSNKDLILILVSGTALTLLGVLPLDTTGAAAAEGRLQAEIDVLLAVQTNHKGRYIHHLSKNHIEILL